MCVRVARPHKTNQSRVQLAGREVVLQLDLQLDLSWGIRLEKRLVNTVSKWLVVRQLVPADVAFELLKLLFVALHASRELCTQKPRQLCHASCARLWLLAAA